MKFHLPLLLRKALLLSLCVYSTSTVYAGIMHEDVAFQTYADFGQNRGRYAVGERVNELLHFIREEDGGIVIPYTDDTPPYTISNEQGMINFNGTGDGGYYAAVAPNAMATVLHNGSIDASYAERVVGSEHAINYSGIDIRYSSVFRCAPLQTNGAQYDYMLQRQSKIVTDAVYNPLTTVLDVDVFKGEYLYHSGGGTMKLHKEDVGNVDLCGGYAYIIGGINTITEIWWNDGANMSVISHPSYGNGVGASVTNPLPNGVHYGDSGSPIFIYNKETKQYEYIASQQSFSGSGNGWSQARGNVEWSHEALESFNARVTMKENTAVVYLNAVNKAGETKSDGTHSTTLYSGTATDSKGNTLASYVGVRTGLNTWADLSGVKDQQNWYAYNANSNLLISDQDLYFTNNLVFTSSAADNHVVLNDTVDLGIGYAEFNGGTFTISSASGENNLFNHAGYVVNAGAEVHLKLINPENYMREWRKSGAGDFYIDGKGNTNALLNVGGSGTVYLQQSGGYAAYNVLANTGARVVIQDLNQVKRDFTFGAGGAELDMNGHSMDWYTTTDGDGRFTINALTEEAVITNRKGQSTLTYKQGGNQTYLGSFRDTKDSSLCIDYQGGGKLTLNSIHTDLSNNSASGLTVTNGTVALAGSVTVHGMGSATGTNGERVVVPDDWHYADATMDVLVKNGGTFELGSHARLIGDVAVQSGGTFIMREGVARDMEHVEGGIAAENTSKYAAYYGLKGDVALDGGTFAVQFNEGVDADINYSGNVSGTGAMIVNAGLGGGSFTFNGTIDAGITKTLAGGILFLEGAEATNSAGHKWLVQSAGQMSIDHIDMIDTASTGTLVLNRDTSEQVDMSSHSNMILGAQYGTEVQYGEAGTTETLRVSTLGGGGSLVVNFVLSGRDAFTVDGRGNSVGSVKLQQIASDYSGTLNVQSEGGCIVLDVGDAALSSTVNVKNGGVLRASGGSISGPAGMIDVYGAMEVDSFTVRDGATLNLRAGASLDCEDALIIADNSILRANSITFESLLELRNGGIVYGSGAAITDTAEVLVTQGTGRLNATGSAFDVNGKIGAAEGSTLRLENGTFNIYNGNINTDGGTLVLDCTAVNLGHKVSDATQNIGGTLNVVSDLTINARQTSAEYSDITHNINHLNIDNKEIRLVDASNEGNRIYNIASLTGQGTIIWIADTGDAGASRMVLSGDNSFSGALILDHEDNNAGSAQHLILTHDNAARNLVINMWGDSDSRPGLAVNTENAHVAGIGGTVNTFVYAGEAKALGDSNNPVSTALKTLTVDTKGAEHQYHGALLGDATNGLNIVKTGAGTQGFMGSANVVHDVTVLQGHLNFNQPVTVHGDISIAQGAQLTLKEDSSGIRLGAGQVLNVIAGTSGQSAVLNNKLYAEGGAINFGSYDSSAYSLSLVGGMLVSRTASGEAGLSIEFSNIDTIERGTRYLLADGNWSGMDGYVNVKLGSYLNADFNYSNQGLSVTFTDKEGFSYWNGSADILNNQSHVVLGYGAVDSATLSQNYEVGGLYFANNDTFTVTTENGAALSAGYMEISGDGTLVLDAALHADNLQIVQSNTLTGRGELHVNDIDIRQSAQTTVSGFDMVVGNRIEGAGLLRVESGSSLQVGNNAGGHVHLLDGSTFVAADSSVTTNLTMGENELDSRISLLIGNSSGVALNGAVTVLGSTTLSVQGNGELQYHSSFDNLAALELKENAHLSRNSDVGVHLVLDGGSASLGGDDNLILKENVTVKNGGTLTFTGTGADIIDFNLSGKTLTVEGGTVDFGSTRQTMGEWAIKLADGATVTGRGNTTYGAIDFNLNDSTIYAVAGDSSISAVTRLREGNNLNYDVSEGATLTVSGVIHSDGVAGAGSITKVGDGKLVLAAINTYENTTTINEGILSTATKGALSKSEVIVNSGGTLLIEGSDNQALDTNVTVKSGGELSFDGSGFNMLDFNQTGKTLLVEGGTIDFGSTCQMMGSWTLTLSNGANLTGQGSVSNGAMDFNIDNSSIYATSGNSTISAVTHLRDGYNLNYNVSEEATLTVRGIIQDDGEEGNGNITKVGAGKLVLTGANTYQGTTTVNGGILSAAARGALRNSDVIVNSGATLLIEGNDNKALGANVTINTGALLSFAGSGYDMLDYDVSGKTLTAVGGTIDFGSTRQTMGKWSIKLSEGASVIGTGNSTYGAMDFDNNNSTIYAPSGDNTISAVTRLRNGNNLNYDISEGATLTVSGLIHADDAAGKGSITKAGAGTLVLTAVNTYANTTTINGGILSVSVNGALGSSSVVINDGGTLLLGGNNNALLEEDVTINAGGTLRFAGTGADIIDYNKSDKTLTVAGGTIDFGSTRQTIGGWAITLSDGATLTGLGNETYGAIDFNNNNSTIYATSGENTVSAVTRLRNGHNLNYNISEGTTLTVDGAVRADGGGSLTKEGAGKLVLSAANTYANATTINGGTLSITTKGALGSSRVVVNSGGILLIEGSDNQVLESNVTINAGGTLRFADSGYDMLDYTQTGKTLTVAGGTIDFGSSQQTMGDWTLKLSDGASLTGRGNATYGAMDFDINDSTIYALSGESSISAVTRLRDGHNLNYNVNSGATLTVSGAIRADGNGSLTKEGDGTLELSAANTYTNTTTINGGTLSTSVVGALGTSTVVINDGGTLLVGGDNNKLLGENVTINTGGTLRFAGTGADILNYDKTGKTLTVAGGTIDFGSTRQTMGGWNIALSDGATLTGQGNATYGAIDFNNNNSTIYATSGDSTISAVTRVRNGNNLNYDVSEGATLTVSGIIHSAGSANKASITKLGEGQMILSSNLNLNNLSTRAGEVLLTGTQNIVTNVDGAMQNANTAEGTLRLAQDARLEITSNIWSRSNTGIVLDSGAELDISGKKLTITNREEEGTATLAATTATGPGEYTINRTDYQISNAHVTYTGGDATINNKLTNSAIENAGNGILKVNNAENTLSAVHATGGSIKLFSDAELDLKELEIATSFSISAYIQLRERESEEARINVVGTADFGKGITLNADLVMKSGSTLMIEDTVQLGSDALRLESGLTLAGTQYDILSSLSAGGAVTIFSGIETLVLGNSNVACNAFSLNDRVQANEYFTNLSDRYFLVFDTSAGVGMGELSIASMPEPTTTTLSILALAGLVARRRRNR